MDPGQPARAGVHGLDGSPSENLQASYRGLRNPESVRAWAVPFFGFRPLTTPPWHRKWQTSARVVTAETPAMPAQRPRACADRAIRSERTRGGGAAARRRSI